MFFLIFCRDVDSFDLWMDNCTSQNKNWCLFGLLVQLVNSTMINANTINFNFFEPGHTFMSADSFHHLVETAMKNKKIWDFDDFKGAVNRAHRHAHAIEIRISDFKLIEDVSSIQRIAKNIPRPYVDKMMRIKFTRGMYSMMYSNNYEDEFKEAHFVKKNVENQNVNQFTSKTVGVTLSEEQKMSVTKNIIPLMPPNRRSFWNDLL